jgi:hypothetical protein
MLLHSAAALHEIPGNCWSSDGKMQGCMRALERFVAAHGSDGCVGGANGRHDVLDKSLHLSARSQDSKISQDAGHCCLAHDKRNAASRAAAPV